MTWHGFQHGEELGYPAFRCSFCHERGTWVLTRRGDVVTEWPCDAHMVWTLDKLQRREPGSTEIVVRKIENSPSSATARDGSVPPPDDRDYSAFDYDLDERCEP